MKKILIISAVLMVTTAVTGCSSEKKAQSQMEKAADMMQSGNLEGLKLMQEVAKKYPDTKAGQVAAMTISQMDTYRSKSFNSAAQSDAKNIVTNFESYYADHKRYPKSVDDVKALYQPAPASTPQSNFSKYQEPPKASTITSNGVKVVMLLSNDGQSFSLCSYHTQGQKVYCKESGNDQVAEIDRSKGVIEDVMTKGTPLGEIDGAMLLAKK